MEERPESQQPPTEPVQELEQAPPPAEPDEQQIEAEVQRRVLAALQTQPPAPVSDNDYTQAVAQLQNSGPVGKLILDMMSATVTANERARKAEELVKTQHKIPAEDLADAEAEFQTGKYGDLMSAHYAAMGRKFAEGKIRPKPPPIRQVQTAVRSAPQAPNLADLTDVPASTWRQITDRIKNGSPNPGDTEIVQRYRQGKLQVTPG